MTSAPSRKRATILLATGGYANTGISILQWLLLIPLYLHYLGSELYGYWLASGGMLGMLALANFGVGSMLIQRVAQAYGKQDHEQASAYFVNGALVYLSICMLYLALGWGASYFLPSILKIPVELSSLVQDCFRLALVGMAIGIFNEALRGFAQALLRPMFTLVSLVLCRLGGVVATVVLLLQGFGLWAIPLGILVAEGAVLLLNMYDVFRLLRMLAVRVKLSMNMIGEYLRTSPALFMARLGSTTAQESEPLLITMFLGPEVTTAYMVTRKAADLLFNALSQIVGSSMGSFAHLAAEASQEKVRRVAQMLIVLIASLGLIGSAVFVLMNIEFVKLWVGADFVLDQWVVLLIGVGFFLRIFRSMVWQLLFGLGDFIRTSMIILVEGIGRVVCATILLSWVGVWGVPMAMVIMCLFSAIILSARMRSMLLPTVGAGSVLRVLLSVISVVLLSYLLYQLGILASSWMIFFGETILYTALVGGVFFVFHWRVVQAYWRQRG